MPGHKSEQKDGETYPIVSATSIRGRRSAEIVQKIDQDAALRCIQIIVSTFERFSYRWFSWSRTLPSIRFLLSPNWVRTSEKDLRMRRSHCYQCVFPQSAWVLSIRMCSICMCSISMCSYHYASFMPPILFLIALSIINWFARSSYSKPLSNGVH